MSYQENILQAVDMIVSQRLNEMSFDKTIVCRIENDENAKKGEYTVSYQAMTMVAYAANPEEEYKKGQDVYVTVPQGDFNLRKIIIGYVSPSEIPTYLYTNPMKYLVRLSDNLIADEAILNSENLRAAATNNSIILRDYSEEGSMPPIKYLCFAANFSTSGTPDYTKKYGIKFTGEGILKAGGKETINWEFNSSEFQGNPYSFNGLFRQEQLFNIERFSQLNNLAIELFNQNNNLVIVVNDIELVYGYAETDLTEQNIYDKIILYEDNKKEIYSKEDKALSLKLQYIYKDNNNEIKIKQLEQEKVSWFVYYVGAEDMGAGRNWGKLLEVTSAFLNLNGDSYKLQLSDTETIRIALPDPDMKSLQVKAKYNNLISNGLVFLEESEKDVQIALAGSGIELVSEQLNFLYDGATNELIDTAQNSGIITAKLTGAAIWLETMTVTWKIPKKGSMFAQPYKEISDEQGNRYLVWKETYLSGNKDELFKQITVDGQSYYEYEDIDDNYYIIKRKVQHKTDPIQKFVVKPNYDLAATNNIIKCEATYPDYGEVYDSISIGFDIKGTAGTEYTFKIQIANNDDSNPWAYANAESNGSTITTTATFLDPTGKEVEGFKYDDYIRWDFVSEYISRSEIDYSFFKNYMIEVQSSINPKDELLYVWDSYRYILTTDSTPQSGVTYYKPQTGKNFTFDLDTIAFNSHSSNYHGIVKAYFIKDYIVNEEGTKVKFEAFHPIPVSFEKGPIGIAGASTVIYDFQGGNPSYNNESYNINFNEEIEISTITVQVHQSKNQIVDINSEDNSLLPPALMPSGEFPKASIEIQAKNLNGDILGKIIQPLLIIRNSYTSNLLNTWNKEDQIISDEGNYILTQMIGAGTKNDQNQFSGVFMGAIGKETEEGITGLYGYEDGELRFKFTEKGDAFIGTGGDNYISFNEGNKRSPSRKLVINSKNFTLDKDGNVFITGEINSESGEIGGWTIAPNKLFKPTKWNSINGSLLEYGTGIAATGINNNPAFYAGFSGNGGNPWGHEAIKDENGNTKDGPWTEHTKFYVLNNGAMCATMGKIAGWNITNAIFGNEVKYGIIDGNSVGIAPGINTTSLTISQEQANGGTEGLCFWAGATWQENCGDYQNVNISQAPFRVYKDGSLYASNATITGTFKAGSIISSGVYLGSSAAMLETDDASIRLSTTPYSSSTNTYSTRLVLGRYGNWFIQGYDSKQQFGVSIIYDNGIGSLNGTWKLNNSTTIASDINKKNTINTISNKYSILFNNLHPVTYKYNDGTSNRLHTGFIAQEVKQALDIANIDSTDFAGLVIFNRGTKDEEWTLRYEEFIALNTNEIQKLKTRVAELETQLAEIKEKLQ